MSSGGRPSTDAELGRDVEPDESEMIEFMKSGAYFVGIPLARGGI
jgi:hypothetical protein